MSKHTTIDQLKQVAQRAKSEIDAVEAKIPSKVSQLANDSSFQTETQVTTAIQTAISATGHAKFEKADAVPTAETAQDNVLYLVMNAGTGHYDIYAKVGTQVVLLDDTTVDLSGKVDKVDGKGLSSNDFTDEAKAKLDGIEFATDAEVEAMLTEVFGAAS